MSWPDPGSLDTEITTKNPQPRRAGRHARPQGKARRTAHGTAVRGDAREGTRGAGRVVVEVAGGSRCTRAAGGTGGGRCDTRAGGAGASDRGRASRCCS
jgi:hypothetical protein